MGSKMENEHEKILFLSENNKAGHRILKTDDFTLTAEEQHFLTRLLVSNALQFGEEEQKTASGIVTKILNKSTAVVEALPDIEKALNWQQREENKPQIESGVFR